MEFQRAQIVRSLRGHDAGNLYCVMDTQGDWLLLADGKGRRVSHPKRKNGKHVESAGGWKHPTIEKIRNGESVGDGELRRALSQIRDQMEV